ncbi:hypothetical protein OUZ56_005264 [Daphnia magna]|uniref:Uncharacterized protein n=1 Tax=Daphnia magna TaxID=35525 RepID=A0ABQ9YSE1_9CRUS|nr:hypothetical protein OUZ56_005264 [Daphnia magna]
MHLNGMDESATGFEINRLKTLWLLTFLQWWKLFLDQLSGRCQRRRARNVEWNDAESAGSVGLKADCRFTGRVFESSVNSEAQMIVATSQIEAERRIASGDDQTAAGDVEARTAHQVAQKSMRCATYLSVEDYETHGPIEISKENNEDDDGIFALRISFE